MRKIFFVFLSFALPVSSVFAVDTAESLLQRAVEIQYVDMIQKIISENAPNNIDYLLKQQINNENFNYDVIKLLAENSNNGIGNDNVDKLYVKFIRDYCVDKEYNKIEEDKEKYKKEKAKTISENKEEFLKNISNFYSWDYKKNNKINRNIFDLSAINKDNPETVICIINHMAKYGETDEKILDVALESAEEYKSEDMKKIILELKKEISDKKAKIK